MGTRLISIGFAALAAVAQGIVVGDAERRTIDFTSTVNPIAPEGMFFVDPAVRVAPDGTLWIVGTRDESTTYYASHFLDFLETKDFSSWRLHRSVFASKGKFDLIAESDAQMWDANFILHNGQWWLFYCMPDKAHVMGYATAPSPAGPYSMGRRIPDCTQISPSVFRDDDGTTYFVWGQFSLSGAVMKDDFSGFVPGSLRKGIIDENHHYFHENIQLTKRNGIYYLVYADIGRRGVPSCLGYATADQPFGPYTYRGVIIDNHGRDPANWNIGGEIVEFGGRWYVIYHHASNGTRYLRKTSIEPIEFDADGMIPEVEMTSNGAGPLLDPFAETPARIACYMEGNVRVVTMDNNTERLSGIHSGDSATWRYFKSPRGAKSFTVRVVAKTGGIVELRDGKGASYGRAMVSAGDGKAASDVAIRLTRTFPEGRTAVVLGFVAENCYKSGKKAKGRELFDVLSFRFEK